ncbi:MAG: response regulator [Candidatus Thiodiazotropha sp. (ex Dulcina madagascariensis)]|nr:response regulator [Candidatus Thiodiazotropha sp. (ex Dulcina madagascariensis)]
MKLRHQVNLFVLILLGGLATVLVTVGYFAIDRIILQNHATVFTRELDNIDLNIRQSYRELEETGLIGLADYVDAEKKRLLGMLKGYEFGNTGRLYLLTLDGRIALGEGLPPGMPFKPERFQWLLKANTSQVWYEHNGLKHFAVFRRASHWNWLVVLSISEEELFADRDFYLKLALGFSLAACVLAALFSLGISHTLQRRIDPTLRCLQKLEGGDLETRILTPSSDEIGSIQTGINAMIDKVATKTRELETTNRTLQSEIAERNKAEHALQQAKDASEAANLAKSVFLANMSHELRTPLNTILGFSEMLGRDRNASSDQQEKITIINRSGAHLLGMINDVLDLSKIEAGRVELEQEIFDLPRMLEDIGRMFEVRAEGAGLRFVLELDPALARQIKTDVGKLRQILINLAGNAVKFTTEGGLALRARTLPIADAPTMVKLQLEVEDSGPGIAPEQQEHIFDPFVQARQAQAGSEGTGLGLAITQSFVGLLGGEISVESRLGVGSLFRVDLPVALAEAADVSGVEATRPAVLGLEPGQPSWRIVVAEDNVENRLLLSSLLTEVGFEIREAENGEQAVALFEQWQPHFIWMDMRMPVTDGYQATAKIRALPGGDAVKIVAITASAFKEQRTTILEAGCDDVVHKPFKAHEIFDAMAGQLGVNYIHEERERKIAIEAPVELTRERLLQLPRELREALGEAACRLDSEAVVELVERVRFIDPSVAEGLRVLAEGFRFDRILALLEEMSHK